MNKAQALAAVLGLQTTLSPHRSKTLVRESIESLDKIKNVIDLVLDNTIEIRQAIDPEWDKIKSKIHDETIRITKSNVADGQFSLSEEIVVMAYTCLVRGLQEEFPNENFDHELGELESCWKDLREGSNDNRFFAFSRARKATSFLWFSLAIGYQLMSTSIEKVEELADSNDLTLESFRSNRDLLLNAGLVDAFLYRMNTQFGHPPVGCFQQRSFHEDLESIQKAATEIGEKLYIPEWNIKAMSDEEVFNSFWTKYVENHPVTIVTDDLITKEKILESTESSSKKKEAVSVEA